MRSLVTFSAGSIVREDGSPDWTAVRSVTKQGGGDTAHPFMLRYPFFGFSACNGDETAEKTKIPITAA
jgi:hypothetical protein